MTANIRAIAGEFACVVAPENANTIPRCGDRSDFSLLGNRTVPRDDQANRESWSNSPYR
jgi:hypothetical protein